MMDDPHLVRLIILYFVPAGSSAQTLHLPYLPVPWEQVLPGNKKNPLQQICCRGRVFPRGSTPIEPDKRRNLFPYDDNGVTGLVCSHSEVVFRQFPDKKLSACCSSLLIPFLSYSSLQRVPIYVPIIAPTPCLSTPDYPCQPQFQHRQGLPHHIIDKQYRKAAGAQTPQILIPCPPGITACRYMW